ncbi:MAG: lipase family protein [Spirochaetales bacterium]
MPGLNRKNLYGLLLRAITGGVCLVSLIACAGIESGQRTPEYRHSQSPVGRPDGSYDYIEMYRLYNMAEAAWDGEPSFRDTDWELDFFEHEETLTRGLAIDIDETLYIVFRATSSEPGKADRIYNLQINRRAPSWIESASPVQVHRGFMSRYEAVREEVLRRIVQSDAREIVFTGASAGGALSLLAFMDALVVLDASVPLHHVSFGMPRIFDASGARWLLRTAEERTATTSIVRVVNGNDAVPTVPPPVFGYRHVVPAHHIGPPFRWYLVSGRDHHPGYHNTLRALAAEQGATIEDLPYAR